MKFLLVIFLLFWCICGSAQTEQQPSPRSATSLHPAMDPEKSGSKKARKLSQPKTTVDLQQEYYDRVRDVMKAYKKKERLMKKPQYSDPMYFGHKRPPKKRSPKKMRYCQECGIRH